MSALTRSQPHNLPVGDLQRACVYVLPLPNLVCAVFKHLWATAWSSRGQLFWRCVAHDISRPLFLQGSVWIVRTGGDDGELRLWHYIYVCRIESRLMMRVVYEIVCSWTARWRTARTSREEQVSHYRGTSLIRNTHPVGPYNSPMHRDLWWF